MANLCDNINMVLHEQNVNPRLKDALFCTLAFISHVAISSWYLVLRQWCSQDAEVACLGTEVVEASAQST